MKQAMESDSSVYLVTGDLLWLEGHDREPLLANPVVIADLTHIYRQINKEGGAK